jgi:hypothetical protein
MVYRGQRQRREPHACEDAAVRDYSMGCYVKNLLNRENTEILSENLKCLYDRLALVEETLEDLGFLGEDDNI